MADEIVKRRLHVGGLTANITPNLLKDRFSSFGQVDEVEQPGLDGLGHPRTFAFLTLQTSDSQLKKCLNVMSGSTWRGTTLRIAEAKSKWDERLAKEREPLPEVQAERLRRKRRRMLRRTQAAGIGKLAQDMRLVTAKNASSKKFWTETSSGQLIRHIAMRPSHPLPSSKTPASSSSVVHKRAPPSRARRRVINPLDWSPLYLDQDSLSNEEGGTCGIPGDWFFSEATEDAEAEGSSAASQVLGTWRRVEDGEEVETHIVRGRKRSDVLLPDDHDELDEEPQSDTGSQLFDHRPSKDRDSSPLFDHLPRKDRDPSPLFDHRPSKDSDTLSLSDPLRPVTNMANRHSSSSSKSHPGPQMEENSGVIEAVEAGPSSARPPHQAALGIPPDLREQVAQERLRDRALLESIMRFGGHGKQWFEDSDSDDDRLPLRLRGGAPSSSGSEGESEEEESKEGDQRDDEDEATSTSDVESASGESSGTIDSGDDSEAGMSDEKDEAEPGIQRKPAGLREMFAASNTTANGFSLMADLGADVELDEDMEIAPPPVAAQTQPSYHESPLDSTTPSFHQSRSHTAKLNSDPSEPLFFPSPRVTGANGAGPTRPRPNDIFEMDRARPDWKEFHAHETDADMKAIWERDKLFLTRQWKSRHKEAKKYRRRRGGGEDYE